MRRHFKLGQKVGVLQWDPLTANNYLRSGEIIAKDGFGRFVIAMKDGENRVVEDHEMWPKFLKEKCEEIPQKKPEKCDDKASV